MLNSKKKQYLKKVYYNVTSPVSYSGINKIYEYVKTNSKLKFSKKDVKDWLSSQDTYTINRFVRKKLNRPVVVSPRRHYMYHVDSAYLNKWPEENKGYKYFVLMVDTLSGFIWTVPLKTLTGEEMVSAMKKIFTKRTPEMVFF